MNAIAHASVTPAEGPQLDNRRVLAGLIDVLVVAAGALLIGFAAGLYGAEGTSPTLALVLTAWALYYYFAFESGAGQTLGKKVMKIRVVKLDGSSPGVGDIAVRTVLRVVDGLFLYLVGLVVMLATGKRRARLGDLAAGTMIVSAEGAGAAAPPASATSVPAVAAPVVDEEPFFEPAPVLEVEPEFEREPAAVLVTSPQFELEPAPQVELEPTQVQPELEPEPVHSELEPEPVHPELEPEPDEEDQVVVRSVETVSAMDLIMGDDEPPQDPPAGAQRPSTP